MGVAHPPNPARSCLEVEGYLDLKVSLRDSSDYGHRLGAPKERFTGSVVLGSSSALGDALMGWWKWTDLEVIQESSTRWHSPRGEGAIC